MRRLRRTERPLLAANRGVVSRPVIVMWRDAFDAAETWVYEGSPPDPPVMVTSVGWLLDGHLPGYLVVASSMMERDGAAIYGGVHYIPDGMIESVIGRDET